MLRSLHEQIKEENRRGEFLLHDVDFVAAVAYAGRLTIVRVIPLTVIIAPVSTVNQDTSASSLVQAQLLTLWKKFLLNQFHDVLPGSCIAQVLINYS